MASNTEKAGKLEMSTLGHGLRQEN